MRNRPAQILPLLCSLLSCLAATLAFLPANAAASDVPIPHGVSPADIEGRDWQLLPSNEDQSANWPHRGFGRQDRPFISFKDGVIAGSPGCGRLIGTYHRSDKQFTITARWIGETESSCDDGYKKDAAQILKDLSEVRVIDVPPDYWHDDALLLNDAKSATKIVLSPMRPGSDLYELRDTFWHLALLEGSSAELSNAIIYFRDSGNGDVTFSTPSCFYSFPFQYHVAGLEFYPVWSQSDGGQGSLAIQDRQAAKTFESVLHQVASYKQSQGNVIFWDKDRRPIMVLKSFAKTGIENRRWRVAKYRRDGASQADIEGLIDVKSPAEITFVNGRADGSPGCGGWAGTYMLSGDRFTFKGGWFLAGRCLSVEEAQNDPADGALKRASHIEQAGSDIFLRDVSGKAQILLIPF